LPRASASSDGAITRYTDGGKNPRCIPQHSHHRYY